jgi:acyl-CoA synthetase (AMP-forming)/AMP-acid ligase II
LRNYLLACFALSAATTLAACGSSTSSGENVTADRGEEASFSDLIDIPDSELKQLQADDERCSAAISGGAALGERLGHFFDGIGIVVLEGYGLTETSAGATINRPTARRIGSVGRPVTPHTFFTRSKPSLTPMKGSVAALLLPAIVFSAFGSRTASVSHRRHQPRRPAGP